jgi:PAS domain S-box-containing protein
MDNNNTPLGTASRDLKEDLEKYRAIIEGANDGIIVVQDEVIKYANKKTETMLGYNVAEVINSSFINYIHPLVLPLIRRRYEQRLRGEDIPAIYEIFLKKRSGDPLVVEINAKLIQYLGAPADLIMIRDISDRKMLERSLVSFLDAAPDSFYLFDRDLRLVDTNDAGIKMFPEGTMKGDLINKHITELVPDMAGSERYELYQECLETGTPVDLEDVITHPKFGTKHLSIRAFKVGNGLGIISTDVTERVNAEQAVIQTKQQLQDMFDNTPAAVYVKDLQGRYILVNKVWRERTGLTDSDIIGKTRNELFPHLQDGIWTETEQLVLESGKSTQFEEIGKTTGHIYLATKFMLKDKEGNSYALCNSSIDITERKKVEEALKLSEKKYRMLVDKMEEAVMLEDSNGDISFINPRGIEWLGLDSEEEIIGKHWTSFTPPEALEKAQAETDKRPFGISSTYDSLMQAKDGTIIPIKITATPIFTEDNQFNGVLCVYTDMTERLAIEEELRKVKREEELYHTMQSHFIKNDLQKITFALELLTREEKLKEERSLHEIIDICHHASKTIDTVNQIYSVLQSDIEKDLTKQNLWKVIEDAALTFGVEVNIECKELEIVVLLDDFFFDLLSEILKFIIKSTDQGVSISCSWTYDQEPDLTVIISEKFTDPLPEDLCSRISQAVTEEGWQSLGHFSGLTLASVIAQYYGGKLMISPYPDRGNEFRIVLPFDLIVQP